jgi:iron complex outermembrane recepter protein
MNLNLRIDPNLKPSKEIDMSMKSKLFILTTVAMTSLMLTQAQAQTTAPETVVPEIASEDSTEIIVTTQSRREKLRQVPLAVTALSQAALLENHIVNFSDLARVTPGFVSAPNYGFIRNSSMRGISNNQFGYADDPSIAVFTDGVYQGRGGTGSIVNALYDVERVEIVKGPQAALFGRSSIGGAINTIVNQPTLGRTFGDIALGVGDRNRRFFEGAGNFALSDKLSLRTSGQIDQKDGYLKNKFGGADLGPLDVKAARAILRYQADNGLDVSLKLGVESRKQSGSVYQAEGLDKFTVTSDLRGEQAFSNFSIREAVLRAKMPINEVLTATSTTSWRDVKNTYVEDYDGLATVIGGPYNQQSRDKLFQQDITFNLALNRFSGTFGASYFNETLKGAIKNFVNETFAFTGEPDTGLVDGDTSLALLEAGLFSGNFYGYSVFMDGAYAFTPKFKLTAGVRYNNDYKRYTQNITDPALLPQSSLIIPGAFYNWGYYTSKPITSSKTWDNTSVRLAANYELSGDKTLYAAFNQGWKAGGIDSFKVQTPGVFPLFFGLDATTAGGKPNIYNPETSESYETGLKGRFLQQKLALNISAYFYKYQDLQVSIPQGGSSIIANVGRAEGKGVELEARYLPTSLVDLFANAAYNQTQITKFDEKPEQVGLTLNQAPKWTLAAGGTLTSEFGNGSSLAYGATVSYRSKYRNDNQLLESVKGATLTNMRVTYAPASKAFSVEAYVDNVFDAATFNRYNEVTPFLYPVPSRSVLGEPRTFGITVRAKIG